MSDHTLATVRLFTTMNRIQFLSIVLYGTREKRPVAARLPRPLADCSPPAAAWRSHPAMVALNQCAIVTSALRALRHLMITCL